MNMNQIYLKGSGHTKSEYSNLPVYLSINEIKDDALRSLVFQLFSENWKLYYSKKQTGIGPHVNGKKGYQIVQDLLDVTKVFQKRFPKYPNWDIVLTLCYVYGLPSQEIEEKCFQNHVSPRKTQELIYSYANTSYMDLEYPVWEMIHYIVTEAVI